MIAFYKDFILEFFSENSWLGLKSKISNNEKENLEYKLNFLSVSLTHFKLIFHFFFFFFFFVASSVICLQSKSGQKGLNKKFEFRLSWKDWFNLSQTKILAKPDSRRNQIPGETRFPVKPDSRRNWTCKTESSILRIPFLLKIRHTLFFGNFSETSSLLKYRGHFPAIKGVLRMLTLC